MTSRMRDLIPIALTISLGACAHSPMASPPADKDTVVSEQATSTPRAPGLYPQSEFPDMTPEEMGRRFLRFIDSLKQYDQLTLEQFERVMQLKLEGSEGSRHKQFNIRMPESGWHYAVGYSETEHPQYGKSKSVGLNFMHAGGDKAKMGPVCGRDFDTFTLALEAMDFEYRKDLEQYDSHYLPFTNEQLETEYRLTRGRRVPGYDFSRGDVGVRISARAEAYEPELRRRTCVTGIYVGQSVPRQ